MIAEECLSDRNGAGLKRRSTRAMRKREFFMQTLKPGPSAFCDGVGVPSFDPSRLVFRYNGWIVVPLAFAVAAIAAPYFLVHGLAAMGVALYRGFSLVCHQRPVRSFYIFGTPVAVCARCLGIYLGAAVGLLGRTSRGIAMRVLIAAAAFNVLDAAAELGGLHGNWRGLRFLLGLLLGAAAALSVGSQLD